MATAQLLRIVSIASFIPAFPLCVAHSALSHNPLLGLGLLPLASSAGVAIFILLRKRKPHSSDGEEGRESDEPSAEPPAHSIIVFAVDTIIAAALMIVLVFTWIQTSHDAGLAMLAAYATIPFLINFSIHIYLAVREFLTGLAIHDLTQWLAWQVVPADCPDCGHRLRPESPPSIPWFHSFPNLRAPAIPKMKAPRWKRPAWLEPRTEENAPFLADDDENRYRDDPEHGEPSTRVDDPEAVDAVGKRDKKDRETPVPGDEPVSRET